MLADVFYTVDLDGMSGVVEVKGQPADPVSRSHRRCWR